MEDWEGEQEQGSVDPTEWENNEVSVAKSCREDFPTDRRYTLYHNMTIIHMCV